MRDAEGNDSEYAFHTDQQGNMLLGIVTSVPANARAGFAPGCIIHLRTASRGRTIYVNDGTALSCEFNPMVAGIIPVFYTYPATPIDAGIITVSGAWKVLAAFLRPIVTAAGATIDIKKCPSGTAAASGTSILSAAGALDGTTNTNQVLGLSATPANLLLADGDTLCADVTGTTTNATGTVTIWLAGE